MYALEVIHTYVDNDSFTGLECGPIMDEVSHCRFFSTKEKAIKAAEKWEEKIFDFYKKIESKLNWHTGTDSYPIIPVYDEDEIDNSENYIKYDYLHMVMDIDSERTVEFKIYECIQEE